MARILIIADAVIEVPPINYGGTERIIALLAEGLQKLGHTVDLMAKSGSQSFGGKLISHQAASGSYADRVYRKLLFQALSLYHAAPCDVVINFGRLDYLWGLLHTRKPILCVFQNPIHLPDLTQASAIRQKNLTYIGISEAQMKGFPLADQSAVIHNATQTERFTFTPTCAPDRYLAFLGRLTRNKGLDTAIEVSKRTGIRLMIAGSISKEPGEEAYFETCMESIQGHDIEYIGPLDDTQKISFLGNAMAMLFPIRWEEPFGITMIEALSCGTPVIAQRIASTPEVIEHGVTGFLCDQLEDYVDAVGKIDQIQRQACRDTALERFSGEVLTQRYVQEMHRLLGTPSSNP